MCSSLTYGQQIRTEHNENHTRGETANINSAYNVSSGCQNTQTSYPGNIF